MEVISGVLLSLLLVVVAPSGASAQIVESRGITPGAADARYVLRNPFYDGSQSVTVASATVMGPLRISGSATTDLLIINDSDTSHRFGSDGTYNLYLDMNRSSDRTFTIKNAGAGKGNLAVEDGSFSVGSNTFTVTGGKVGVGTSSPDTRFHLYDNTDGALDLKIQNASSGSSSRQRLVFYEGSTLQGLLYTGDGNINLQGYDQSVSIGHSGSGASSADILLNANRYLYLNAENDSGSTGAVVIKNGGAESMRITSAGNVGIGTTAPAAKLSVSSSTASSFFFSIGGAMTKAEILAYDPTKAGEMFFCTDCVAATICVSTGTAVADMADIGDRTVACN